MSDIGARFGVGIAPERVDMHEWNADWDVIYPFSGVSCNSWTRVYEPSN